MRDLDRELVRACGFESSLARSLALLARGADVNAREAGGATPLTEACAYGARELVQALLDAGADPDLAGEKGRSPITFAATCVRNPDEASRMVQLLVERGADVNARDDDGYPPLLALLSSDRYQPEVAKRLVEAGADVTYVGPYETMALVGAAARGDRELVELLLDRGAAGRDRALEAAIRDDRREVVVSLVERGANHEDLLAYAAGRGYAELVRLDGISRDDAGHALALAAGRGQLAIVELLVARGIDPAMDFEGREDPLMKAARYGHVDVAEFLLAHGASLEATDRDGQTALAFAAAEGQLAMLRFLLDRGAKVDAANRHGWTPLAQAYARGREDCARELIRRGADAEAARRRLD